MGIPTTSNLGISAFRGPWQENLEKLCLGMAF